ncbi:MAG: leucine-rich repeat domain-containing protein [Ruminiclostridium sp.]
MKKWLVSFFITLAAVLLLPSFSVNAEAASKKVEIFGNRISANAEKICFMGGEEGATITQIYESYVPDYKRYYYVDEDVVVDCAEIAEKLPNLKRLAIVISDVKNLESLSELKNLTMLELYVNNGTEDISFVKKLPNLKMFRYIDKDCTDISPVKYLTKLTNLNLSVSPWVKNTSVLKNLTKLETLEIDYGFENLDNLYKLTKLKTLKVNSSSLTDVSKLTNFKNLRCLEIQGYTANKIKGIANISKLTKLKELVLHSVNCSADDFAAIKKLKNLKTLYVCYVRIMDVEDIIAEMTGLETLVLMDPYYFHGDCRFTKKLTNLKELILFDCIDSLYGMGNLKKLECLDVSYGYAKLDLNHIKGLKNLKYLNISFNSISDISMLGSLTKLETLHSWDTDITDYSVILKLKKLKRLLANSRIEGELLDEFMKTNPDCVILY